LLAQLDALVTIDLRNSSRIGGDVANLTALPVLMDMDLSGSGVHSSADSIAAGHVFCSAVTSRCSRCEEYRDGMRSCATGYARTAPPPDSSCHGAGVGNDDCACCAGTTSVRAYGLMAEGSGDWAGRPLSSHGTPLHYGSCIDRTCADRNADGIDDDDDCPDAPPGVPAFDNRRMKMIRCSDEENCADVCPVCWLTELELELASRLVLHTSAAARLQPPALLVLVAAAVVTIG
jgi:hypothetical protein